MGTFLTVVGFLGFIVLFVMAIVGAIRKTGKGKKRMLYAAGCFILMIIGVSVSPDAKEPSSTTASTTVKSENKTDDSTKQKAAEEDKKKEDEQKKAKAEADAKKKAEAEAAKKKAQEEAAAKKKAEEEAKKTPQQKMLESISGLIGAKQAFDAGSYIKGDIPAGEYAFITFPGGGQYYAEKDPGGNIIDNENFDSFGYVYVHDAGNLETRGVLININAFGTLGVNSAKQIYETLNKVENYKDSGWYKVGVDIQPGQYVIESYGEGYVAVMAGPVGKSDIVDNENFNGRYSVNVKNGQYLKISRAKIAQ